MAILNRIFERPATEDITNSLGNMLLSGVKNQGSKKLYFNMLMNLLRENKTVVLVNGSMTGEEHTVLQSFVHMHIGGRMLSDFNMTGTSDSVDILSAFQSADQKAEFITLLVSSALPLTDVIKNQAKRMYLCAVTALEALGKKYKIREK